MIKIGLLGLGTVGAGTVSLLQANSDIISERAGVTIAVAKVLVRDLDKPRDCDIPAANLTVESADILFEPEIKIVVELLGGTDLAFDLVKQALMNGKHVVTANKALIAKHGNELLELAHQHNVMLVFEAAVAGGIPILKTINAGLTGNRISRIAGIVNGTSNFILSQMQQDGLPFATALAKAQELGFAEADPTFDIEGVDAAHKLAILASLAFVMPLAFDDVYCEGISAITPQDIQYTSELGFHIKHIALATKQDNQVSLRVHPCLIKKEQVLAHVDGVMNAVLVQSDALGESLYYGAGAGASPTASAVVADIIDVIRHQQDPSILLPGVSGELNLQQMKDTKSRYYLRLRVKDRPGVLADITRILADNGISIEVLLQKETADDQAGVPVVFLTHQSMEAAMTAAISAMQALADVLDPVLLIRGLE